MANKNSSSDERDQRLDEVLANYLDAVEGGQKVDREEWLRRYPDLAGELAEFFANHDQMAPLAGTVPPTSALDPRDSVTVVTQNLGQQDGAGLAKDSPFGSYEVLEEIGRGGMGIIYRARQVGLNRIVALKVISAGAFAGAASIRRFRIEAGAAAALDHPNIVPVYEIGEHQGNHYFSMRLIEGGSLAQWLATRSASPAQFSVALQRDMARMVATIARAVHHAHQRGVLHRDLKPANILLQRNVSQPDGSALRSAIPLVTDFGLAKRARPDGSVSQSLNVVGTASYMAPEQALPNGAPLTVAADVYSLGAVLYEMLIGRPPFRGDSFMATLIQAVCQPPVPPQQLNPKVNADLGRICLKCLNKAPSDRYAGADALAQDLENWTAGEPVSVRPLGRAERTWRRCRRHPVVAFLLFAVAGLLLTGAVYSTIMNVRLTVAAADLKAARDVAEANAIEAEANAFQAEANAAAAQNARREADARALADQARETALAALKGEQAALDEEKKQRAKSQQLLARQYVSNGAGLFDESDPLGALGWFVEALSLEQGDALQELPHRVRVGAALRRCPRMIQAAFLDGGIQAFCLNFDGLRLFTAERNGPSCLWDTATGKAVVLKPANNAAVLHAAFSPDGRLLATGDKEGQIRLWDAADGTATGQPMLHAGTVTHVSFDMDGKHLLSASKDGMARVWESPAGRPLSEPLKHGGEVTFAAFSPGGRFVVTASNVAGSGEVRVWDWAAAQQLGKAMHLKLAVLQAAFSADSRVLYTAATSHNLRRWDPTTGKALSLPAGITGGRTGLWFNPDGRRVLLCQGTTAQVFDLASGQPVGRQMLHGQDVLLAAFSPDGRRVVTAAWDRVVRAWDTASGQPLTPPLRHPGRVLGAAFDGTGQRVATGCDDGTVRVWDIHSRDQAAAPLHLKTAGDVLAVSPGGQMVFAVGASGARVWNAAKEVPFTPPLEGPRILEAAFNPHGNRLVTLDNEAVRIWDLLAKAPEGRVLGPSIKVQQITFSPDGSCVAARLAGDQFRTWDTITGKEVAAGTQPGFKLADPPIISPDGRRIVVLKFKQQVQVVYLATGKLVLPVLKHSAIVINAAFSPDGKRLATACADGTVHIWDATTAKPLTPPFTHGQFLRLLSFSLDGRRLVTSGDNGTARIWDTATGQPLTPFLRQAEPIAGASFSPEGDRLATANKDGIIHIWDIRPDNRPVADLVLLARFLSGQQMHAASGSFVPFDRGDLRQSWPQLRSRFPAEFGPQRPPSNDGGG